MELTGEATRQTLRLNSGSIADKDTAGLSTITVNKTAGTVELSTDFTNNWANLKIVAGGFDSKNHNLTVTGFAQEGGTFTAPSSNFRVSTDFSHTGGIFNANKGTVTLTGANQKISGSTTFYNLTKAAATPLTLTFEHGKTQVITNTLTLRGAALDVNRLLSLRSDLAGSIWEIDPRGGRDIWYLDVQDSNNIASVITTNTSKDSGNNNNWNFSHHLDVSGIITNQATDTANSVEVKVFDAYGGISTSYTGTVGFTSSDSQATLPGSYTFTHADNGVHMFSGAVKFATGGGQTVTVTDILTQASGDQAATVISPTQIDEAIKNIEIQQPPAPEPSPEVAQNISLGEGKNMVSVPEEGEKEDKFKKLYATGKYRTVVIVFEGKVMVSPYDEEGVKEEETVALAAGQSTEQHGEIK
jgi:hypothetical protein